MNQRQDQEQREREQRQRQGQQGPNALAGVGDYEEENRKNQDRERDRKATQNDLEEQTGNPGHRGLNRNEGYSMNPAPNDVDPAVAPLSINEPPGSEVITASDDGARSQGTRTGQGHTGGAGQSGQKEQKPLPSDAELNQMTRAELDTLAKKRGIDSTEAPTKADVIEMLTKDASKRT